MPGFGEFERELREALNRLYDPGFEPSPILKEALGAQTQPPTAYRPAVVRAIENLRPDDAVPPGARARRVYDLLNLRYVQKLDQDETAERLGITPRHLRREQQLAIQLLARSLWPQAHPKAVEQPLARPAADQRAPEDAGDRLAFIRAELEALRKTTPHSVANLPEAIAYLLGLENPLLSSRGIHLKVESIPPGLNVVVPPPALHQVLITGIEEMARYAPPGTQISVSAESVLESARLTLRGDLVKEQSRPDSALTKDLATALGGSARFRVDQGQAWLDILLPAVAQTRVLVVDDNADLVHLYSRYTTNTRYRIVELGAGRQVLQALEAARPHLVVLDVMLPDIDGYQVLSQLRRHPLGQDLPIIVCSVVGREELALALGATLYVPKPVTRHQFVEALDRAWAVRATETRGPGSLSRDD